MNEILPKKSSKQISLTERKKLVLIIGGCVILAALCLFVPNFSSSYNLFNVITQAAIYGTMSMGLAFVLITGGIDISLPYVMTMGAVVGVTYMNATGKGITGCLIIIGTCMIAGIINGFSVAYFQMPPMIVTLAMGKVAEGFAKWYTNYESIRGIPKWLNNFFKIKIFGVIPMYCVIFLIVVGILSFILSKTVFGRWLYLVGTNKNTAQVSGIPIKRAIVLAYIISSIMAGIAGVMLSIQSKCATARLASSSMLLEVLASAIIGGVSDKGGRGSIIGVVFGAVIISATSISLNLLGVQPYPAQVIKGVIMIAATIFDYRFNSSANNGKI